MTYDPTVAMKLYRELADHYHEEAKEACKHNDVYGVWRAMQRAMQAERDGRRYGREHGINY